MSNNPSNLSSVVNISALKKLWPGTNTDLVSVWLQGTTSYNTNSGVFTWDGTSSASPNDVTIINPTGNSGNGRWLLNTPSSSVLTPNLVTPRMYGADPSNPDNTSELQDMFDSGYPVLLDDVYSAVGPFTINGSPSIQGFGATKSAITITGTAGGITINCPVTTNELTSGHILLSNFGIFTTAAETTGNGALKINFAAQAPATLAIPTLDMQYIHIGGVDPSTDYFTNLVTVVNGQSMNFIGNFLTGHFGNYADTEHGFLITNASGAPAMGNTFTGNYVYQCVYGFRILATAGVSDLEGFGFFHNMAITNDYGFVVDATAASVVSPGWIFVGNETNSAITAMTIRHAAQIWISSSMLYVNTTTANGVVIETSSNTISFSNDNIIINVSGGVNTGSGIKSIGSGPCQVGGGTIQSFSKGIDLDAGSSNWTILPIYYNTVTTHVSNLGPTNTYLSTISSGTAISVNDKAITSNSMGGDSGNANTVVGTSAASIIRYNTAITADRTVSFSGTFTNGQRFTILRQAGASGAFNVIVAVAAPFNLTAIKQWATVQYDGANWIQVEGGVLY